MTSGTGLFVFSDIYTYDNIVRHTGIVHGRNLIIDHLRESFARDREYRYVSDIFGYPKTPSHLGLAPDAKVILYTIFRVPKTWKTVLLSLHSSLTKYIGSCCAL